MGFHSDEEFLFFELAEEAIDFSVARFRGKEGLSQLYEFKVELISEEPDVQFEEVVGQGCVITIQHHNHEESDEGFGEEEVYERFIHGIVSDFEIADEGASYTTYYATVVPKIWVMQHRHGCRIFQGDSIQDIVQKLLQELGLEGNEYRWDCQGSYAPYTYCVQYRESELNFIHRLLEHEGIFYFFEHEDDKHVLVFNDDSTALAEIEGEKEVTYAPQSQGLISNQHIYQFRYAQSLTPGKTSLRDYNFLKPTLKLQSEQETDHDQDREVYDFPGWFADKARGDALTNVRLQSANALRERGTGKSNINRLTPGYAFEVDDDTREEFNNEYLLVSLEHSGVQAQIYQEDATTEGSSYNNRFVCIPRSIPFRPARTARIPIVEGTQTAIVTGPQGEEIYTDEYGRVKVQFHWDRLGKSDQDSSCWIRVSQLWAGLGYGGFSLPRIGQEVIVDFIEGNPDNPIIIGRVHNGDNRTPYKLPDKRTVSTLKTNSSKGGEGFNEFRFEDKKGEEQIFIHAQKNKDIRVKNDCFEIIGNERHQIVENNRYTHVKVDDHHINEGSTYLKVTGDVNNTLEADLNQSTKGDENYNITGERKADIKGSEHLKAATDIKLEAGMNYGLESGMKTDVKAGMTINLQAGMAINLKAGPSFISIGPAGVQIGGPTVMINSGGSAAPASPAKPAKPGKPDSVTEAQEADKAEAGKVEKVTDKSQPIRPSTYGPQAKAMKSAAESGTPFCEQCEAAKKSKQKKKKG